MSFELEKVRAVFLSECEAQLASLEQGLLALESSPGPKTLLTLFRRVHTLEDELTRPLKAAPWPPPEFLLFSNGLPCAGSTT